MSYDSPHTTVTETLMHQLYRLHGARKDGGKTYTTSVSIIVQQDATIHSLLHFCKLLALHVSGGKSTHHQEHI